MPSPARQPTGLQRNILLCRLPRSAYIRSLDTDYLAQAAGQLPDDAGSVIGLGGGQALDAAKYVAVAKDLPLIQVPTIVSTGAIIHGHCATFHGRTLAGGRDDWVWADCEYVLVDHDLVLAAPDHLNTAGSGDVLCEHAGIAEWRSNQRRFHRLQRPIGADDPAIAIAKLEAFHSEIVEQFPATCDAHARLTPASIQFVMNTLQRRDGLRVRDPHVPNADHAVLFTLEEVNDKSWIHGEVVALGALIICWRCGEAAPAYAAQLNRCQIRYRPSQIGISQEELRRGLAYLPEYVSASQDSPEYHSILRRSPIVDEDFDP